MLPTNLLPSGALDAMRNTAQQFMQQQITLYKPVISYNQYGQQVLASGTLTQVSGYIGGISGSDKEIVSALFRTGVEIKSIATLLMPVNTVIDNKYKARVNETVYNVVWNNSGTMEGVHVYCKAIVIDIDRTDEALNYDSQV
jgi:hypothetical protein